MKRIVISVLFFFLFFSFSSDVSASLVTIKEDGQVILKVLGDQTSVDLKESDSNLDLKEVINKEINKDDHIALTKEDGKIALKVGGEEEINVTNMEENLIEVEEKPKTKKITVRLKDGKFMIEQNGVSALTDHAINIDPSQNKFLIDTSDGKKFLNVFPYDAAQSVLRTRILNQIDNTPFEITEKDDDIYYVISGEKVIKIISFYDIKIPITAKVSASTGEVFSIDKPDWLKFISFLFV